MSSVARSAGVIGFLTLISRILGFVRDILIALFFGTGLAAEAFVVSFKIPNLFRDLAGEGAMNSAIVPVLSEVRETKGPEEFRRLAWTLSFWFLGILVLISALGTLFAPWVVRLAAPGFAQDPEKFAMTVRLTRIMFPFIFFIGSSALLMGVLNTLKKFASSAAGPILLNASMIVSLLFLVPVFGVESLVAGVLVGGVLQCILQLFSFRGSAIKPVMRLRHPEVRKILRLLTPRLFGTAVYQTSVFVDTILASFYWIVGAGGQSALYYASRLFQFPLAIVGVSFAQAALPTLSGHAAREETAKFKEALLYSMGHVAYALTPAAVGLAVFSDIIVRVLFERGAFTAYSSSVTSQALFFYSLGLLSCAVIKILVSAFYALQDTRTPVVTAAVGLLANILLNLVLMWHLKIGGLALATTLSATLNAVLLWRALTRKIGRMQTAFLARTALFSGAASIGMGIICFTVFRPWVLRFIEEGKTAAACAALLSGITVAGMIYLGASLLLNVREAEVVRKAIFCRGRKS